MLFSQPQVAEFMSSAFECAWESVRPVPRVSIDFGNGHTLERTLHGNIVTYFCNSAGAVFDLLPGLVDAGEFLRRLKQARRLGRARGVASSGPSLLASGASGVSSDFGSDYQEPWAPAQAGGVLPWDGIVHLWHAQLVARSESDQPMETDPIGVFDGSKMLVERRIDRSLLPPLAAADAESLRHDTLTNRVRRYPLASQLWLEHPFAKPREIKDEVYRRVLGVDLDDPYLGLAPEVLGGEPGRH